MTGQANIITDLSTLLRVSNKTLNELVDKINLCISSIVNEAKLIGEPAVQINIGIGTLSISLPDMLCKFIPSKALKTSIKKGMESKIDPLELVLDQIFTEKLLSVCEEVC